jgi:hypothetical protein
MTVGVYGCERVPALIEGRESNVVSYQGFFCSGLREPKRM